MKTKVKYGTVADALRTSKIFHVLITRFCYETTTFLNSLNEKIYLEITEIRQEFEETKIKLDDIVKRKEVKVFAQTIEKNLNAFRMKFRAFQSKWTGTMADFVSDIKNNKNEAEKELKKLSRRS